MKIIIRSYSIILENNKQICIEVFDGVVLATSGKSEYAGKAVTPMLKTDDELLVTHEAPSFITQLRPVRLRPPNAHPAVRPSPPAKSSRPPPKHCHATQPPFMSREPSHDGGGVQIKPAAALLAGTAYGTTAALFQPPSPNGLAAYSGSCSRRGVAISGHSWTGILYPLDWTPPEMDFKEEFVGETRTH